MEGLVVGRLAKEAGVDGWTVRFYEAQGLLPKAKRSASGYRLYEPEAADRIRFIKKAQGLGLSLKEIHEILKLSDYGRCPCGHVEEILQAKLVELHSKIKDLKAVEDRIRQVLKMPVQKKASQEKVICQRIEQHRESTRCSSGSQPTWLGQRGRRTLR